MGTRYNSSSHSFLEFVTKQLPLKSDAQVIIPSELIFVGIVPLPTLQENPKSPYDFKLKELYVSAHPGNDLPTFAQL